MADGYQTSTEQSSDRRPPPEEAGAEDTLADESTLRELAAIGDDLLGAMRESIAVAKAESRLFVSAAALAVALAAFAAVLLAGAWFTLVAALALGLNALGVPGWLAALLVAVVLAAGAVGLFMWIRRLITDLTFSRTRQVATDLKQTGTGGGHEHDRQTQARS